MCVCLGVGTKSYSSTYRSAAALYNEWLFAFNIFGVLSKWKKTKKQKDDINSEKQVSILILVIIYYNLILWANL